MRIGVILTAVLHLAGELALGQVQTFRNDYPGFVAAAGPVSTITFDHLPDGTPSAGHVGTPITSTFNYDLQGAHFSSPVGNPFIAGNTDQFQLRADTGVNGPRTWIIADLTNPARAVGVFFPGGTTLCAFGADGVPISCASYFASGEPHFLGLVSATPIARLTVDQQAFSQTIDSFVFAPVPEPGTAALFGLGGAFALGGVCRSRRDGRAAGAGDS